MSWPEKSQFSMPPFDRRSSRKVTAPLKQDQRKLERKFDNTVVRTPRRPGHTTASFSEEALAQARAEANSAVVTLPPSRVPVASEEQDTQVLASD